MIKKRLTFQLINATSDDFEVWKSSEKEINLIALKYNIVRTNRLDDDVKHTTSVDITAGSDAELLQAIMEISKFHEKHLSGIDVKVTQQVVLENSEISFVIGAMKDELNNLKNKSQNGEKQ